jgi:hypothetical protein
LLVVAQIYNLRGISGIGKSAVFNNFHNSPLAAWQSGQAFAEVKNNGIGRIVFFQYLFKVWIGEFLQICFYAFFNQRFSKDLIGFSDISDFEVVPYGIEII